jgi:type VI secretion system protein ImpL
MPIFLKHIEGGKADQLESFDKDQVRLGRQSDNDVRFDPQKDISVSGYHAEIYRDDESFFIKDLQSRNGTFVNSRKIDQPVSLKEGDTIQLSARGPKLVFSTKDPSLPNETAVMAQEPGAATLVSSVEEKPQPERKAAIWEHIYPYLPIGLSVTALLALVGVGRYLGYSWWVLLVGAAATLLITGGAHLAWRFWQRRKALREQKEVARQEREASLGRADQGNFHDLKRKWTEVLRSLRESKLQRSGDDVIYALPWFMVIGEPGCGKSAFVKGSGPLSCVATDGQQGPTGNCDWWFFDKLVVLDTSGRYVFQAKESDSASEWRELLTLLRNNRRREPINGVVVALAADSLASRPVEKLKEQAAQLRERLDEMVQRLGVKFPVYLVITKGDRIAGFNEFFGALPDQFKGQALGYVNSDAVNDSDTSRFLERAFRTLCERAERLRLATLCDEERTDAPRGKFLFPAELQSLHTPLKTFVDVLFRPSPYRDAPFFRGLFLTSARQAGVPLSRLAHLLAVNYSHAAQVGTTRDCFQRDLFSVILPNDRAIVGSTALGLERYRLTRAAGLIAVMSASLLLCGFFVLSFTNNWLALSRLNVDPCTKVETRGVVAQVLRPLDECRESIDSLTPHSIWKRIFSNFGLNQTHRIASALQKRFLISFLTSVLKPLDARIDQSLSAASADPLVVGSVIQRIQLLARCQDKAGCAGLGNSNGLNYRVLLAVGQPLVKEGDPAVDRLRRTNESFLRWQTDRDILREMYAKDLERIRRWLDSGGLNEDRILESARTQFSPVRAADFWGVNAPAQVDAAYTAQAWRDGIAPLTSGLQKMTTKGDGVGESVAKFELNYRTQALRQWGEFLTDFPQAEKLALQKGMIREIALSAGQPESPYNRVIDAAYANLSVVLGDAWKGGDLQPWAATLKKYVAFKAKIVEAQKTGKQMAQEAGQGKEADAVKYLTIYLNAMSQVRTELSTTEKSFLSSKKAFEEGEPSAGATQPILKASWALGMLRDTIGSPQGEDRIFWILLGRPVFLSWKALLEEAGKYLQQQWEGLLLEVKDLDAGPKGGKIIAFVNGSAAVFLTRRGGYWAPRRILDQSVPFTDAFVQYLSRLRLDAIQSSSTTTPSSSLSAQPPAFIVRTS